MQIWSKPKDWIYIRVYLAEAVEQDQKISWRRIRRAELQFTVDILGLDRLETFNIDGLQEEIAGRGQLLNAL